MSQSLLHDLPRATKSAALLQILIDNAISSIRKAEAALRPLNIRLELFAPMPFGVRHDEQDEINRKGSLVPASYHLGYARDELGEFGLVVKAEEPAYDENDQPVLNEDGMHCWNLLWLRRADRVRPSMILAVAEELPRFIPTLADLLQEALVTIRRQQERIDH